jgi:glycopeptide antibiotics resistance protein
VTEQQMLDEAFRFTPQLAAAWLAPAAVAVLALVAAHDHAPYKRRRLEIAAMVLVCCYVVGIGLLMLWPLKFRISEAALRDGNWLPLRGALGFLFSGDPIRTYLGQQDVFAHALIFAPLGLLLPFVFAGRRGIAVVIVVAVVAFGFEVVQGLAVPARIFDIDQALTGATAAFVAAIAANGVHLFVQLGRLATR